MMTAGIVGRDKRQIHRVCLIPWRRIPDVIFVSMAALVGTVMMNMNVSMMASRLV
jgi:hypothetical protein